MTHAFLPTALLATAVLLAGCGRMSPAVPTAKVPTRVAAKALDPAKFFARAEVQAQAPQAFATRPEGVAVLEALETVAPAQRAALVRAIKADKALAAGVAAFPTLAWEARLPLLKRVMKLEAEVMGMAQPPLVVHDEPGQGPAFFEFDPEQGGTGTVHLWPKALASEPEPYAALMLTIHETRHSWQFQQAFGGNARRGDVRLATGFAAGFKAQKALAGKLSFCDFCTMHHEHEAFQTGNQVVGELTGWQVDMHDMGVWSSQFDAEGRPRLDLLALAREVGPARLLAAFNEREQGQFAELGGARQLAWRAFMRAWPASASRAASATSTAYASRFTP